MHVKSSVLWMACLVLTAGPVLAQTAPGAPGSNEAIPEKQAPPLTQPDADVQSGRSLSQKLDDSGGVIKPPSGVDPAISKPAPDPDPNSMPVIKPGPGAK